MPLLRIATHEKMVLVRVGEVEDVNVVVDVRSVKIRVVVVVGSCEEVRNRKAEKVENYRDENRKVVAIVPQQMAVKITDACRNREVYFGHTAPVGKLLRTIACAVPIFYSAIIYFNMVLFVLLKLLKQLLYYNLNFLVVADWGNSLK